MMTKWGHASPHIPGDKAVAKSEQKNMLTENTRMIKEGKKLPAMELSPVIYPHWSP